ncbi:MAG: glycosyltransferase [Elainella sp. Prado103]|nr:glycosyltransferase [Elainella sp. Prado103]
MRSTKTVIIELSQPLTTWKGLGNISQIRGIVQFQGSLLGEIYVPVQQGICSAQSIAQAIFPHYTWAVARELVRLRLAYPKLTSWRVADLLDLQPLLPELPSITVVCCIDGQDWAEDTAATGDLGDKNGAIESIDQASGLKIDPSLVALDQLTYPNVPSLQVWVVEANPQSDRLQHYLQQHYPHLHYGSTSQSGLSAARNWAIDHTQSEIIAFTDSSSLVAPDWAIQIGTSFVDHPEIDALTGLILPATIETAQQQKFEAGYGRGRGLERRWYRLDPTQPVAWPMLGTMQMGSGMNMAFRRSLFQQIGAFDTGLDQPNLTWGGGDWEIFLRLLLAGKTLLYEPAAIVQMQLPSAEAQIRAQLTQEMIAFYAYLTAGMQRYPDLWLGFVSLGLWKLARLVLTGLRSSWLPRAWVAAELQGIWQSWGRYPSAQEQTRRTWGLSAPNPVLRTTAPPSPRLMAVRLIDLSQPLMDLTDVTDYQSVRLFLNHGQTPIGRIDLAHGYQPISAARLRQAIADRYMDLLALPYQGDQGAAWTALQTLIADRWLPTPAPTSVSIPLSPEVSVSIIITTCDRPTDLANCLHHLQAQQTDRSIEIIVADNRPHSGITPPVVAQFPGVKLVSEARPGGSYGRNAAIAASTGEIIVSVDDDVVVPPDWLEKLIAPLVRPEVMVVTGNVLPLELETAAQLMFEQVKNGLSQGFQPFEVNQSWLDSFDRSPPTWELGVSANAAFRATLFSHPRIGLMEEVLGPGTPSGGGGEENHLLYKVLRAGYTIVYEPAAYVWHRHRRELPALYRQVYGHMKGGTAYHLVLWRQEKDPRGFRQLFFELPRYYTRHLIARLKGHHQTPWRMMWSEINGYFAGFWGYWQSCQQVKRQGRSAPYIPVAERLDTSSVGSQAELSPTPLQPDHVTPSSGSTPIEKTPIEKTPIEKTPIQASK